MDHSDQKHSTDRIRPSSSGSDRNDKAGGKRKRMPGTPHRKHNLPEDIPWTAARCNRLLRSIISRIQILRRLSENNFADKALAKKSPARRKINFNPEGDVRRRISPDGVQNLSSRLAALPALESPTKDGDDPEWLPDDGCKPSQRTYAGKGARAKKVKIEDASKSHNSAGAADFRSPFIKRILGPDAAKSPTNVITDTPRKLTSQKIVLDPKTHAERALRTLLDSFNTILSTTAPCEPGRKTGARSLRNMCLRQVPLYIDYEQKYAYDNGEYDFDATECIYLQMEQKPGAGRSNDLRETLRAHAVKLIVDAFDERSWPVESLDRFLDVCERNQAVAEGQRILQSWFAKAEGRNLNRVARFMAWSKILNCNGFFFRVLRETLEAGRISLEELNQSPGIWQELLKAMARKSTRIDAVDFFEAYITHCSVFEDSTGPRLQDVQLLERLKRDEILRNIMALLTALCWKSDESSIGSVDTTSCLTSLLYRVTVNVGEQNKQSSQSSSLARDSLRTMGSLGISSLVLFALDSFRASGQIESLHAHPTNDRLQSLVLDLLPRCTTETPQPTQAEIICSAAKCIAHSSPSTADKFIQDISTSLLLLPSITAAQQLVSFRELAIVVASSWADYRSDKASYTFADEIECAVRQATLSKNLQLTPRSSACIESQKFRWEEAIGEWIAATPLPSEQEIDLIRYGKVDAVQLNVKAGLKMGRRCTAEHHHSEEQPCDAKRANQDTSPDSHVERPIIIARQGRMLGTSKTLGECSKNETSFSHSTDNTRSDRSDKHNNDDTRTKRPIPSPATPPIQASSAKEEMDTSPESPEQPSDSPLQAKSFPSMQSPTSIKGEQDRDELSATPHYGARDSGRTRIAESVESDREANILASARDSPLFLTPLAIRTRQRASQHIESCIYVDRDELAMTPAQPELDSSSEAVTLKRSLEPTPESEKRQQRDELAATPAKRVLPSTRVLRSAMKKIAGSTRNDAPFELYDDLAMTPGYSKNFNVTKHASLRNPQPAQASERDELGVTPGVPRTCRSRSKQLQKADAGMKNKVVHSHVNDKALDKPTKMPLKEGSGNVRTANRGRKITGDDDELCM